VSQVLIFDQKLAIVVIMRIFDSCTFTPLAKLPFLNLYHPEKFNLEILYFYIRPSETESEGIFDSAIKFHSQI